MGAWTYTAAAGIVATRTGLVLGWKVHSSEPVKAGAAPVPPIPDASPPRALDRDALPLTASM